jgi:hypothetical protein
MAETYCKKKRPSSGLAGVALSDQTVFQEGLHTYISGDIEWMRWVPVPGGAGTDYFQKAFLVWITLL